VLQVLSDRVNEIGRCHGMEVNVEKTKIRETSRQPSSIRIVIDQKQQENVEYLKFWDTMVINDA
jgi:hypothetical protein